MTEEQKLKFKFAEEWLRHPNNAFAAAQVITGNDAGLSWQLTSELSQDSEVLAFKEKLLQERGEDAFLPSSAALCHQILDRAATCQLNTDFVQLIRLIADIRGFIQKPGITINNTQTTNKVMLIPMRVGSDGKAIDSVEWERQLTQQQMGLIGNG